METNMHNAILKVAETRFVRFGIRAVSIDDICNEIHISKKTFYTEFAQKEDLVAEVYGRVERLNENTDRELNSDPSLNAIDRMFLYRTPVKQVLKRKYEQFQYEIMKYYPDMVKARLDERTGQFREALRAVLEEGKNTGLFRDDLDVQVMTSFIAQWRMHVYTFLDDVDDGVSRDRALEVVLDAFIRMVVSQKGFLYYQEKYLKQ